MRYIHLKLSGVYNIKLTVECAAVLLSGGKAVRLNYDENSLQRFDCTKLMHEITFYQLR